ncbi:hypothetical protein [Prochlorococcus marinus]|uniref:Uncharacterized protein n=1 Tax=Prochlorococcus marinus (strain MIT 9211) TaxID=93059 RepID=A9BB88_PROM4|nr:hypothetical protein [Prochlorococcus marinus]ABX09100.1 Hypothetical protein P9211_11691 [Prochlorococcus marinus str. MIT 9211]
MDYPKDRLDESHIVICGYISSRLKRLNDKDRHSLYSEYKEWLKDEGFNQDDVWSIPDLTDEGLCDFFKRAISQRS